MFSTENFVFRTEKSFRYKKNVKDKKVNWENAIFFKSLFINTLLIN